MAKNNMNWEKVWSDLEKWWGKQPKKITQKWLAVSYSKTRKKIEQLVNKQLRQCPKGE